MTATETQARTLDRLFAIQREMKQLAQEASAISCHGICSGGPITNAWHAAYAAEQLLVSLPAITIAIGQCLEVVQKELGLAEAYMSVLPHPLPCDNAGCEVCKRYRPQVNDVHPDFPNKVATAELANA